MTREEFNSLSLNDRFKFTFYHGRIKYGILSEGGPLGKVYLINSDKLPDYKNKKLAANQIGEEINIETIARWESIEGKKYANQDPKVRICGSPKARKLIIIGAGASYGFLQDDKSYQPRPPLAKDLFADCYNGCLSSYPGAKNMAAEILQAPDIEAFFQNKWNNVLMNCDNLLLAKLINVQFYLHDLFLQISKTCSRVKQNNYNSLFNLIHDYATSTGEHVPVVNFNYDTLGEESMINTLQYDFSRTADYVDYQNRKILLFKPHGSCNLIKKFDKNILSLLPTPWHVNSITILSRLLYDHQIGYDLINANLQDGYTLLNRDEIIRVAAEIEEIRYLPQLLLPFKSKDDFVMPPEHEILLDHFLSNIDEILAIGWKGTEEKFQDLLRRKIGHKAIKITCITNGDPTIEIAFRQSIPQATCNFGFKTFSEYMKFCVGNDRIFV